MNETAACKSRMRKKPWGKALGERSSPGKRVTSRHMGTDVIPPVKEGTPKYSFSGETSFLARNASASRPIRVRTRITLIAQKGFSALGH
ncbi:uncharacterized protein CIMG_13119 [Coccidioides immitis RS]|uniref:Uncharacterized protein n=1 Tax=Coccidioides immitis (strain RS) TaxID=246410 RepID=A0A0D8JUU0_COCIM|nr:uncharacterized protein CIMG_13119 [Coccidioides immitis RS]KJF60676.1 hypothetical protein CIMG_13119 [Coccidioides immitis RS]